MGMTEAILFGTLSLCSVVVAVYALRKLPLVSMSMGLLTLVFAYLSACNWRLALLDSGKNTAWLGAERYPLVLCIYIVLFGFGFASLIGGTIRCIKKNARKSVGI